MQSGEPGLVRNSSRFADAASESRWRSRNPLFQTIALGPSGPLGGRGDKPGRRRRQNAAARDFRQLTECPRTALIELAATQAATRVCRKPCFISWVFRLGRVTGGEGGIRTPDRLAPMPHFECGAFDHSATSPGAMKGGRPPSVGSSSRRGRRARQGAAGEITGPWARPMPGRGGTARREKTGGPVSLHCNAGREVRLRWPS
jgi:hypothetical protein